jgi:ABC-type Fe3+ transport system permease subunit
LASKRSFRWLAILVAIAGIGICLAAVAGFLFTVGHNELPWRSDQGVREHYVAVGRSYSQGFVVGFFLCFFLTVIAVSVAALLERRRDRVTAESTRGPAPAPRTCLRR